MISSIFIHFLGLISNIFLIKSFISLDKFYFFGNVNYPSKIFFFNSSIDSALNGNYPVTIENKRTPRDQISAEKFL